MESNSLTMETMQLELRAERETRELIACAARAGLASCVIEAIASDPIPVEAITDDALQPTNAHISSKAKDSR
jgi:hypothetical protein